MNIKLAKSGGKIRADAASIFRYNGTANVTTGNMALGDVLVMAAGAVTTDVPR